MTVNKQELALNELLREVANQHRLEAQRCGVEIRLHLDPSLPPLVGDPLALERVFSNLVHNGLKFTPAGGRVEIRSRHDDGLLIVAVSDTGAGIAAAELSHLFQRYRQTDSGRTKPGTGMGLFIVKSLVEAHGGAVGVDSAVGLGTSFEVRLPIGPDTHRPS
jgi:signal transduction histidine kinase